MWVELSRLSLERRACTFSHREGSAAREASLAQLVERESHKLEVESSLPTTRGRGEEGRKKES